MEPSIERQLIELNRIFYDRFALVYSKTREHLQPGILRALEELDRPKNLLDIGCGDGRIARALGGGSYTGLDFSEALLEQARLRCHFARKGIAPPVQARRPREKPTPAAHKGSAVAQRKELAN